MPATCFKSLPLLPFFPVIISPSFRPAFLPISAFAAYPEVTPIDTGLPPTAARAEGDGDSNAAEAEAEVVVVSPPGSI